jgi:hypothetical protein
LRVPEVYRGSGGAAGGVRGAGRIEATPAGRWARLPSLTDQGLVHGFSCRDMGGPAGPEAALASALGLGSTPRARLLQRHTGLTVRAAADPQPEPPPVGDALVAAGAGVALQLATADCVPILVVDPGCGAFAAVHAGWRGTLAGILPATLRRLSAELGARPAQLRLGVGPAIRACCYEVGREVAGEFEDAWPQAGRWLWAAAGRVSLDLIAANRDQAAAAGVPASGFLDPGWCTRCRSDLFWSHRAEGPGAGRIVTLAAWRPPG